MRHCEGWPGGAKLLQGLTQTTLEAGHGSTPLSPFSHGIHLGSCATGPARFGSPGLPLGAKLPICNLLKRLDKVAWNIPLPDRIRGSFGEFMSKQDNKSLALQACGDHVRQRMPSSQPNGDGHLCRFCFFRQTSLLAPSHQNQSPQRPAAVKQSKGWTVAFPSLMAEGP